MTIVVARYNEKLDWVIPYYNFYNFKIYNKGENNCLFPTIQLKNVGRESHTYLTHIIDNYNNLDDYNVFLQGNPYYNYFYPKNFDPFQYLQEVDFIPLGTIFESDSLGFPHHPVSIPIRKEFEKIFNRFSINNRIKFVVGAQFLVSKEKILKYSINIYKKMLDLSLTPEGPWILERFWMEIFTNNHLPKEDFND